MAQILFKLLACFLLTNSIIAQQFIDQYDGAKELSTVQADPSNPGYGGVTSNSDQAEFYNKLFLDYLSLWPQNTGSYVNVRQPAQPTATPEPPTSKATSIQRDFNINRSPMRTSDTENSYRSPYTEPTGPPYGLRSIGEVQSYKQEKLDLTKCGPQPTSNPCRIFGRVYHELPGYPECYIQCAFGRMFVKPCPTDLEWNARFDTCDWKTIPPADSGSEDDALVHDNRRNNENVFYRFERTKRSTIERKKRNLAYNLPQNQGSSLQQNGQFQYPNNFRNFQPSKDRMTIQLRPFYFPGPVSFPSRFGIPSLSMQATASQQYGSLPTAPETAAPTGVARSAQQYYYPSGTWSDFPARTNFEVTNPPVAPTNLTQTQTVSVTSPSTTSDSTPEKETSIQQAGTPQGTMGNIPTGYDIPAAMYQANPSTFNPYAAPNPVPTQVTLIPGPLYPYGPPFGGPFGGPLSKTPKRTRAQKSASKGTSTMRSLNGQSTSIIPPVTDKDVTLMTVLNDPAYQSYKQQLIPYLSTMKRFGLLNNIVSAPKKKPGSALDDSFGFNDEDDENEEDEEDEDDEDAGDTDGDEDAGDTDDDDENAGDTDGDEDYDSNGDSEDTTPDDEEQNDEENDDDDYDDDETSKESSPKKVVYQFEIHVPNTNNKNKGFSLANLIAKRQKRQLSSSTSDSVRQSTQPRRHRVSSENAALHRPDLFSASPCLAKPPRSYTAHPNDPTKYVACFNKFYYQIMSCPSSLIYNSDKNKCEKRKGLESLCEREKPCKNEGLCYQTDPKSFKCTCRGDWTGDRCEIPLSTCANKPCGEGNECITVKTSNAKQDYVCVCNEGQSYGLNCERDFKPNPCLSSANEQDQYYPFEFSSQAFIQCNGDILYVQPCPSGLHWNATQQVCDVAVTVPPTLHEYEPQHSEPRYYNEQQKLLNTPHSLPFKDIAGQERPTNTLLPSNHVSVVRNLPISGYTGTQDQPSLINRPTGIVKPLEKPDAVKTNKRYSRYNDAFGEVPTLPYSA